ncbi:Sodium/calcium exchanger protein-domain-containing protein [Kockovaella imperatae]|uniref:Sodium/calcium exchanger protein-domain-containing protein n=1 Tax=Kockovaella imperatae TaxID=4999 RepID=A0A1Y1UFS5_9TREE|nr:Sodium/calcium exchanger protein-domain-containing protein [Kockovaella imperatae]ORX36920.1 Sodium/calcium exchanger protein-domain-containing protein [Kockovaella imperatae]
MPQTTTSPASSPPMDSQSENTFDRHAPPDRKSDSVNSKTDGPRRRTGRNVTVDPAIAGSIPGSTPGNNARQNTSSSARSGASSRRGSNNGEPSVGILRRMTTGLLTPDRKIGKAPTYGQSIKAAVTSSWLNILLVFIPIGWALHFVKSGGNDKISDTAVFCTTFIAIIPLAGLLGFATEEAALRMGQTLGGLLNATLGNAVELIVAILALIKCELSVVQSSLVGSILSNILLVLGMCFFAGGVRFSEQAIKSTAAQLNSSLLLIAVIAVLIPSAFHFSITTTNNGEGYSLTDDTERTDLLAMSHGVAVLLLVLYLGYLTFQMWTHAHFYSDEPVSQSTTYPPEVTNIGEKLHLPHRKKKHDEENPISPTDSSSTSREDHPNAAVAQSEAIQETDPQVRHGEDDEEEQQPEMNIVVTIAVMVLDTVLVGVTAEFLVDSINGLVASNPSLSAEWVGLILLPIVGNAAEHFTAVSVSVKDKLDLSISVAVGSSIQIALFVIPVIELLAWCISKPLTLLFDPFESVVLFLSVLIVNQTLSDGRSNWMEGLVLMFLYLIIAVSFWYYPGSNTAFLAGCASGEGATG